MSLNLIEELLQQLKPVIKSQRQVRPLLEQFWSDKIALVWISHHVHRAANEQKTVLTEAQARQILHDLHAHYDRARHGEPGKHGQMPPARFARQSNVRGFSVPTCISIRSLLNWWSVVNN